MSKISNFLKEKKGLAEFLRYLIIGFSTTFLNWGISIALKELTNLDENKIGNTIIVTIAWAISTVCFAFWMYKFFVFRSKSMKGDILWKEFAGFTGARLLTWGVEALTFFVFCDMLDFDHIIRIGFIRMVDGVAQGSWGIDVREYYIVKFGALVITTIVNYIFSKLVIFKKGQKLSLEEVEKDEGEEG
ncbi:MAG: GtrA family protein [Clostridia bacterium]|nr:GtrA family protein [Clostridia bacterium]